MTQFRSFQEFLQHGTTLQHPTLARYHFPQEGVHTKLTTYLVTYLLFDTFDGSSEPWIFLRSSGDSERDGTRPLFNYICEFGDGNIRLAKECDDTYEIVTRLLEKRYELLNTTQDLVRQYHGFTADGVEGLARMLRFVVAAGWLWAVKRMLNDSPNLINFEIGNCATPLILAAWKGNLDMIELLLDRGADVNLATNRETPLIASAGSGYDDALELFLKRGADVNGHGLKFRYTALHWAASVGRTSL